MIGLRKVSSDGTFFSGSILYSFYIPTLNERPDDILVIARNFLNRFSLQYAKEITGFTVGC